MKRFVYFFAAAFSILMLAGCGKSADSKEKADALVQTLEVLDQTADQEVPGQSQESNMEEKQADKQKNEVENSEHMEQVTGEGLIKVRITSENVNVREFPSTESNVLGKAFQNDEFEFVAEKDGWSQIVFEEKTAFIKSEFLEKFEVLDEGLSPIDDKDENPQDNEAKANIGDRLVVIDAGHQEKGNSEKEPVGPGATEMKAKVSSGTQGVASGLKEYELNLTVSLKLQGILEERGYQVIMVRTTNNVDMSNSERAQIANEAKADIFIRVHANGSENSDANGMMTICPTDQNPYCASIYEKSKLLSELVLDAMVDATGALKERVWETDTMSGINWCEVPVTIVEMGYMTNKDEDLRLADDQYQEKIAEGIANGIDSFFLEVEKQEER